jgi:hypothetical protein
MLLTTDLHGASHQSTYLISQILNLYLVDYLKPQNVSLAERIMQ